MKALLLTIDQLAAILQISVKSIRRAYRKGEIPVERICRFVRFDLERVKEAMQGNGHGQSPFSTQKQGPRSATGGASRRRAQRTRPRLGKTGASIARTPRRKK
ncbi:helix-turn-helix domain-containing protein [Nitrospira defluvii]|uniref:HTH_17 domain-containing protein n=1 Tax=Nitrospira defluvii TaxID=330214 RepID=A0ABM8RHU4_9BACT|nr:helix-turn-helix domain-containing protein [Nitrospira defluvii]CAE6753579.1 HTH_17 domain-containing protein [Nitrospira defluvii]